MKQLVLVLTLLASGGAVGLWCWSDARGQRVAFRTVPVRHGDLQTAIHATGTIEPEDVVDVGAQIAGEIQSFGADPRDPARPISYGSPVDEGTVLARLDDALLKARVGQARAKLARAEADVQQAEAKRKQAERELERARKLQGRGQGFVSSQEYDNAVAESESAEAALAASQGGVAVARADLDEAVVNLGYATIRSPVKGVILDRRVNIGQTVVASLNAPSLFLIAKDLSRMEIWASVNETDIGGIHAGQPVRFTVGAFPGASFRGRVGQIRLNASMVQSVVTYTVVVEVDNSGGRLLPYLTARLEFEVERRPGVLLVPNAALRFRPRPDLLVPRPRRDPALPLGGRATAPNPAPAADPPAAPAAAADPAATGTLWVAEGNFVRPIPVRVGLSDGGVTEVAGDALRDGLDVVVGVDRPEDADADSSFLPFTRTDEETR